jgi:hypothetical protein
MKSGSRQTDRQTDEQKRRKAERVANESRKKKFYSFEAALEPAGRDHEFDPEWFGQLQEEKKIKRNKKKSGDAVFSG